MVVVLVTLVTTTGIGLFIIEPAREAGGSGDVGGVLNVSVTGELLAARSCSARNALTKLGDATTGGMLKQSI